MKNLLIIFFLSIVSVSFSQDTNTFSAREMEMVNEINVLRTNPKSYIPMINDYIKLYEEVLEDISKGKLITTMDVNGEIAAAYELIEVLSNIKPLTKLIPNNEMYLVSKSHGQYLKSINRCTHYSKNGNVASKRMINVNVNNITENLVTDNGLITPAILLLLVDGGIKSRGHRTNLLDPNAKFISVYTNGDSWVQNFAN